MGVTSYEVEISSPISPARLFKALVLEADTLIPEIIPQAIKSIEVLEGNGGPGTIRKLTFAEGLPYTYSKNRTESLDAENFTFKYSMLGGDILPEKLEKITTEIQIVSDSDGTGSIFTSKTDFHTVGEAVITEEEINKGKEEGVGMFKAIEAYLLKNPDVCN